MSEVETSVEPPEVDEGGGDEDNLGVSVNIFERDGTMRACSTHFDSDSDHAIADAPLRCLRAVAAHRGPGLQVAIQQAMGELP